MRIALDAMGGDHGPRILVPGALRALRTAPPDLRVVLLGDAGHIRAAFPGPPPATVEIVDAPEVIRMDEPPATAVRRKPNSSLARGLQMLREGEVSGLVSAGSTGAVVAGALLRLGRIGGVRRPAIATPFPTSGGRAIVVDVGANSDCKPIDLVQFAAMGAVYAQLHLGLERPRVGLLNIGEEEGKGNELAVAAYPMLRDSGLEFVGNVEGRDVLGGRADVVVCDGFVGNIVLKFGESMLRFLKREMTRELAASRRVKLGAWLMRPAFERLRRRIDYQEEGGAPLLGVDGVVVIAHGKSSEVAIANALNTGFTLARNHLPRRIGTLLQDVAARVTAGSEASALRGKDS